jgi:hypothetical protein
VKPKYAPPRVTFRSRVAKSAVPATRVTAPRIAAVAAPLEARPSGPRVTPYVDYDRSLTDEGGIRMTYKAESGDLLNLFVTVLLWLSAMVFEITYIDNHAAHLNDVAKLFALVSVGVVNYFIVFAPHYAWHSIEIRPDCMIINGRDLFWLRFFDTAWPAFKIDENGAFVLRGIYGSRQVEFLTINRFDEHDRMPELLARHLSDAMRQMWQAPRAR